MSGTVAVLGAGGTMGSGMARNIARAGIELVVWNRSREKAQPLASDGARVCDSAAEAAAGAGTIVTMLSDADAVLATMQGSEGALAGVRPGSVWVQMSTIGEQGTARCIELAREHGLAFVDAPVLGTKQPAAEGRLVVMASGAEELRERVQPIFDAVARRTIWLSEEAGAGTRLKLVTNAWIVAVVEGAAETIALAEGLGFGGSDFFEAIDGGPLDMPYLKLKGRAMIERDFEPTFALKLASKDARLAVESAGRLGLDLPVLEAISRRMQEAVPEHGDEDLSATYLTSAPDVGDSTG
ncbi:MAG TPA: NAD(P)-dependent oxidoreductase [Solirubrobacteraceae bacterium]|jgi:3-hydroxyisobutyrate dehydrogenase|nr:NAD(P)-dependent oxidoreductase [Solirubrobacteraceae bacterium]